jgi:hypothetical protein
MGRTTDLKGQLALSKAELRALELGYIPIGDILWQISIFNSKIYRIGVVA